MDPYAIQAEVRRRGRTLAQLAREAGVDRSTVQTAIYRRQPTGNRIIASFLEKQVHEIWPDWFDRFGNAIRSDENPSSDEAEDTRQKASAA